MIGVTPQHLSRLEGSDEPLGDPGRDKMIRLIYRLMSGDGKLRKIISMEKKFAEWITSTFGPPGIECTMAARVKSQWHFAQCPQAARPFLDNLSLIPRQVRGLVFDPEDFKLYHYQYFGVVNSPESVQHCFRCRVKADES